jgi:deoxyribodipyrimidine photolyase-related protein
VDGFNYAVTHEQAAQALDEFIEQRLVQFGVYEDAMSGKHDTLFHSVLSPYINIGLLEPMQMARAAEAAYDAGRAPINSVEGFVRQVIGWREYIYWQYWRQMPDLVHKNSWEAGRAMPAFFWDGDTRMNCLAHVIRRVIESGWTHHIERLMVVSNFCLMAGIHPQAVLEWFITFYIDAYDWVMQPNVVGMGLNADDGMTATKPYISSANYIHRMSDYCEGCYFKPDQRTGERACPYNYLYWNFLIQHEETLRANARFGPAVLGLRHLDEDERHAVQQQAKAFLDSL